MTYAERIEAVARALCRADGYDPDAIVSVTVIAHLPKPQQPPPTQAWEKYVKQARAADAAVLEARARWKTARTTIAPKGQCPYCDRRREYAKASMKKLRRLREGTK